MAMVRRVHEDDRALRLLADATMVRLQPLADEKDSWSLNAAATSACRVSA